MNTYPRISESERRIMEIIWKHERALTTSEIIQQLSSEKNWKQNTVITFLSRLTEKGMVKATRRGRANYYEAIMSEKAYRNLETKQFINKIHKGSVTGLISALCESGDLTKTDIEKLMKDLEE